MSDDTSARMRISNTLMRAKQDADDAGMDHVSIALARVSNELSYGGVRTVRFMLAVRDLPEVEQSDPPRWIVRDKDLVDP